MIRGLLYSRRLMALVQLMILIMSFNIIRDFTPKNIFISTVILAVLLAYVCAYASRHVDVRDSASAIILSLIMIVLGVCIGLPLTSATGLGPIFYAASIMIISTIMIYILTKYVL